MEKSTYSAAQSIFVRAAATEQPKSNSCGTAGEQGASSAQPSTSAGSSVVGSMPRPSRSVCPVVGAVGPASADSTEEQGCPVIAPGFDPSNLMPSSSNAESQGQARKLGTGRVASSIPVGTDAPPGHQPEAAQASPVWLYPSEQMFYNAMLRKGWKPNEEDMNAVVAIHNGVNERAWREIQRWEELHGNRCGGAKLKRFRGRPQDFSPKARILNALGYRLPFDRHDWVVDRCGREVRYVIDFYNGAPLTDMPLALHLDVRPALDSPSALLDRLRMQWRWVSSGRWVGEAPRPRAARHPPPPPPAPRAMSQ